MRKQETKNACNLQPISSWNRYRNDKGTVDNIKLIKTELNNLVQKLIVVTHGDC